MGATESAIKWVAIVISFRAFSMAVTAQLLKTKEPWLSRSQILLQVATTLLLVYLILYIQLSAGGP